MDLWVSIMEVYYVFDLPMIVQIDVPETKLEHIIKYE